MVHSCCLCKKRWTKNEKVSFHRFPKNQLKKEKWLKSIGKSNVANSALLCSQHFKEEDYIESIVGNNRCLKSDAVPTILQNVDARSEHEDEIINILEGNSNSPVNISTTDSENILEENQTSPANSSTINTRKYDDDADEFESEIDSDFMNYRKISDVDWDKIVHSPKKMKLCWDVAVETINEQNQEIHQLKRKLRKITALVTNMKSLMKDLKSNNILSLSLAQSLEVNTSPLVKILIDKIIAGKGKFKTCPNELRSFATTLYFYSPKAYDYVRKEFIACLPHPSTVRSW